MVVPFTTPMLAFSRVRPDQNDGLEILVPGMSGGAGVYVIGWPSVKDVFRMSVHDRALHEAIETARASTPRAMRTCAHQVALTGLSGPDAIEGARQALAQEENERVLTNYFLMSSVIDRLSDQQARLSVDELTSPSGKRKVREVIAGIAKDLNASPETLYRNLEVWSDLISPIGLFVMPHKCRLRNTLQRIESFRMNVSAWGRNSKADAEDLSFLAAGVAQLTLDIGTPLLGELDDCAAELIDTLRDWSTREREIRDKVNRLSWLVDGWEHVLSIWNEVLESAIYEQVDALEEIARMLPLVPTKELEEQRNKAWGDLENALRKFVKPMQSWQSGEHDMELVLRVEKHRSRTL